MNPVSCTCGRLLNPRPELAGKKIKCPACNALVQVPAAPRVDLPADAPAPAAASNPSTPTRPVVRSETPGGWKVLAVCGVVIVSSTRNYFRLRPY
jgi:hypothetical protein